MREIACRIVVAASWPGVLLFIASMMAAEIRWGGQIPEAAEATWRDQIPEAWSWIDYGLGFSLALGAAAISVLIVMGASAITIDFLGEISGIRRDLREYREDRDRGKE